MNNQYRYDEDKIKQLVSESLNVFYTKLIGNIDKLDLRKVLKKKNPYLYRAKGIGKASDMISALVDAYISSSEETIFGDEFFEPIAIEASGGIKSTTHGLDIEPDIEGNIRYAISVKSGTSAFNDGSKKDQKKDFEHAIAVGRQAKINVVPVIGYGYGKKNPRKTRIYEEIAGQAFWELITGDSDFYKKLIDFMGSAPEENRRKFLRSIKKAKNRLTLEFIRDFCFEDGTIDWDKLVQFNSGKEKVSLPRRKRMASVKSNDRKRKGKKAEGLD